MAAVPGGIADVQSRLAAIQSRFASSVAPLGSARSSTPTGGSDFAGLLGEMTGTTGALDGLDGTATTAGTAGITPAGPGGGDAGRQVVELAKQHLGTPYVWGGTTPAGFDCSGLVQYVYRQMGVELPRVSRDQARAGRPVASLAEARPGDLVAFGSPVDHIGIYAGDGKMVVAPKRGDVVKVQDIYRTPVAIRRVLPEAATATAPTAGALPLRSPVPMTSSSYDSLFRSAGAKHGVDPGLLAAVAKVESNFDPRAISPAGARGLMQIMPATARELGVDPMDPASAVDGAARLLASHLRRFGATDLALAAYNAGPGAVARHGGVPPYRETQGYVRRILDITAGGPHR